MAPDRWQRIEALFHSALERDPASRPAFLDGACGQDADLRREVASLLAGAGTGQGILDHPFEALLAKSAMIETEGSFSRIQYYDSASGEVREGWAASGYLVRAAC